MRVIRKPILLHVCENKGEDQLRGFRHIDSTIPLGPLS